MCTYFIIECIVYTFSKATSVKGEAKRWMVWRTIWNCCIKKTHIYAGMFYIEAGVFCIEVGHKVSHHVYWQISELYNCWNPQCHCFNIMVDIVFRCNRLRNSGLFFLWQSHQCELFFVHSWFLIHWSDTFNFLAIPTYVTWLQSLT